jgi:4-amino-4-deoxy-L-arabinose transferase-like glycosyltransferase
MRRLPEAHWSYPLIAALAAVVMLVRVVLVTNVYNNTIDEPYHIGSAVVLWEAKQLVVGAQHPPLARWVIGAPLFAQGVRYPEARDEYVVVEYPGFDIGRQLLFSGKLPYWRMLLAARHSLLVFSLASLFFVYRLGKYLGNSLIAMLATVFFSLDPTLLAHSALVGTDVAGCAGFLWGFYYGLKFCAKPQAIRAMVCGIALGLAISCKLSSVLLIPALIIVALFRRVRSKRPLPSFGALFIVCVVAFMVLWGTYGLAINPMRQQAIFTDQRAWTIVPEIIREQPIPMPSLFLGQLLLAARAAGHSQPGYLNGQISTDGWLLYFPEAIAVKEPVGMLLAVVVAIAAAVVVKQWRFRAWILFIPILVVLAVSMRSRYQLGVRHMLPILPLMYLFAVIQLTRARWTLPLLGMMLLAGVETAAVHPDYLAFFNFACGGPSHGDRYLIDSNLDWGQDIYRLSNWLKSDEAKGRDYSIRCAYATGPMLQEFGLDPAALQAKPHGLFAISKNVFVRFDGAQKMQGQDAVELGEDYSWVTRYPLVKRIGYSIDVYDLDAKDTSAK